MREHARNFKRVHIVSKANVMTADQYFEAVTANISVNGLYVSTDQLLPVGKLAEITLNIPSVSESSFVNVIGEVVRSDFNGLAFKFKSVDLNTFSRLRKVIAQRF